MSGKDFSDMDNPSISRTIHDPRQITELGQPEVGRIYELISLSDHTGEITGRKRFKVDSLDTEKSGWITVTKFRGEYEDEPGDISLADMAVIPYSGGRWNNREYIIPIQDD